MKNAIAVLFLTAAALAAQASAGTGTTSSKTLKKTAAASKATAVQPVTIPVDAVANPDGSFTWTDRQGKKWSYVKTPFGIIKSEVTPVPTASASLNDVKVFDEGDKVRFEKTSPFGLLKWEKNKTELTNEERDLVSKQAASQTAK